MLITQQFAVCLFVKVCVILTQIMSQERAKGGKYQAVPTTDDAPPPGEILRIFAEQFAQNTRQIEEKSTALNTALQKDFAKIRQMFHDLRSANVALEAKCAKQDKQIANLDKQIYEMTRDICNLKAAVNKHEKQLSPQATETKL